MQVCHPCGDRLSPTGSSRAEDSRAQAELSISSTEGAPQSAISPRCLTSTAACTSTGIERLPDHCGKPASGLTRSGGIVGQLTNLHPGAEHDELGKVDPLTGQAGAQAIEGLTNGRSLGDRMTRMRGWHANSVARCRTAPRWSGVWCFEPSRGGMIPVRQLNEVSVAARGAEGTDRPAWTSVLARLMEPIDQ